MPILYGVLSYLSIGTVFSILFLIRFIEGVDKSAKGSPLTFRIIIFPGCVVLWPVLLQKYLKTRKEKLHD